MVRKLKHHEQKLLRKVDFTTYASDNNHRDAAVIRRYAIQKPGDYQKYNRLCGVRAHRPLYTLRETPILTPRSPSASSHTSSPRCRPMTPSASSTRR